MARVKIAERREEGSTIGAVDVPVSAVSNVQHPTVVEKHRRAIAIALAAFIITVSIAIGWRFFLSPQTSHAGSPPRSLVRLTFDGGLQSEPTWSPDGGRIAYSSDRAGNFDILVQQTTSTPVPVTSNPAHDWQPDWSPDGSQIVFRSERNGGGLRGSRARRRRDENRQLRVSPALVTKRIADSVRDFGAAIRRRRTAPVRRGSGREVAIRSSARIPGWNEVWQDGRICVASRRKAHFGLGRAQRARQRVLDHAVGRRHTDDLGNRSGS